MSTAISKTSLHRVLNCILSFNVIESKVKYTARLLYLVIVTVAHFADGYLRTYF